MIEGAVAALKIVAIVLGIFAVWYLNRKIRAWYQRFIDWNARKEAEKAKEKTQADKEKYSGGVKRPPRGE